MNDVVRCSVCDNQMPVSVEYCGVCGTMNPFYAVWKESGESGGAASPDVQPSAVASEEDQEAPIDFDYSALFGTQSQEETIPDTVPHGQSGDAPALDLASLFTWGEPEASTETPPTADTALAIEPAPAPEPVELPERVEPEGEAVAQAAAEPSSDASIEPEAEPEPDVEAAPEPLATLPEAAEVLVAPIEPLETPIASVETAPTSDDQSAQLLHVTPEATENLEEPSPVAESATAVEEGRTFPEEPAVTAGVTEEAEPLELEPLAAAPGDEAEPEPDLSADLLELEPAEQAGHVELDEQSEVELVATLAEEQEEPATASSEERVDAEDAQLAWEPSPSEDSGHEPTEAETPPVPEPEEAVPPILAGEIEPEPVIAAPAEEEAVEERDSQQALTADGLDVDAVSMEADSASESIEGAPAAEDAQTAPDAVPEEVVSASQISGTSLEAAPEKADFQEDVAEIPSAAEVSETEIDDVSEVEEATDVQLAWEPSPPDEMEASPEQESLPDLAKQEEASASPVIENGLADVEAAPNAEEPVAEEPSVPITDTVMVDSTSDASAAPEAGEEPATLLEGTPTFESVQPAVEIEAEDEGPVGDLEPQDAVALTATVPENASEIGQPETPIVEAAGDEQPEEPAVVEEEEVQVALQEEEAAEPEPVAVPAPMPISADDAPLAALSPAEAVATFSHKEVQDTAEAPVEEEEAPVTATEQETSAEEAAPAEQSIEVATLPIAEQPSQEAPFEPTQDIPQEPVSLASEPAPEADLPPAQPPEPADEPPLAPQEEPIVEPEPAPAAPVQLRSRLNVLVQAQPPALSEPQQPLTAIGGAQTSPTQSELSREEISAAPLDEEQPGEPIGMEIADPEAAAAPESIYQPADEATMPDMLVIAPRLTVSGASLSAVAPDTATPTSLPVSEPSSPLPTQEIADEPAPLSQLEFAPLSETASVSQSDTDVPRPEAEEQPAAVPAPGGAHYAHASEPHIGAIESVEPVAQADVHQVAPRDGAPQVQMAAAPAHEEPRVEEEPAFDLSSLWSDVETDEDEETEAVASPLPESISAPEWDSPETRASQEASESPDSQPEETVSPAPLRSPYFYSVSPSPQPTHEDTTADYLPTFVPSGQNEPPATTPELTASLVETPGDVPVSVAEEVPLPSAAQLAPASEAIGAGGAPDLATVAQPAPQSVQADAPPPQPPPLPFTIPSAAPPASTQYEERIMPETPGTVTPTQSQSFPEGLVPPVPITQAEMAPPPPAPTGAPYIEQPIQMQPQGSMPPALDQSHVADAPAAPDHLDLSALFEGMEIDTSEPDLPPPIVQAPPVETAPPVVQTPQTPAPTSQPAPPPTPVMPMTIKPSGPARWPTPPPTQPAPQSQQDVATAAAADSQAWKAFAGMASAEASNQPLPLQPGMPQPQSTLGQPQSPSAAPVWQPGQPRPQPGTPEYDAMVKAALAQRGVNAGPASAPQPTQPQPQYQPPQPQYPQSQPVAPAWQPGQPRPQPGTPEYDAMVQAALAQRGVATGPITSPQPQQPYSQPSYPQPQPQAPAWQPGQPRPQPGTPEYDEMVRAALAQRGVTTGPLASPPQPQQPQSSQAPAWQPGQPRPKPGTPEYDEMVRRALEERRQREGR